MLKVAEYYDDFSVRQLKAGINNRHISIAYHLKKNGLKKNCSVLEIGCGIGTVSELILRELSTNSRFYGVDISPRSITIAKMLETKYKNAFFETRDLTQEKLDLSFDCIVLPDVIEHIPLELHTLLFRNIYKMLNDEGFVFIHIPHPNYLEWQINNKNDELQIIDQPIHTDLLVKSVYPVGFYIHYINSYSVYSSNPDYQIIVLKKKLQSTEYPLMKEPFQLSLIERIINKAKYYIKGGK